MPRFSNCHQISPPREQVQNSGVSEGSWQEAQALGMGFSRRKAGNRTQRNLRIDDIGSRPSASQSARNLPDNQMRRPLFGEILATSPSSPDLGYGIPSNDRRRQGSEGSMQSPNPMFPQERGRPEISPSSASAWYLRATLGGQASAQIPSGSSQRRRVLGRTHWRFKTAMNSPRPQTKLEPGTIQRPMDPAALQRR